MPAKKGPGKRVPRQPRREDLEDLDEIDEFGMTEEERELGAFFENLGDDFRVHLIRYESSGDKAQCGQYTWDQMKEDPAEFIRREWGPGKYRMSFRRAGAGWSGLYGSKVIHVAKKPTEQVAQGLGHANASGLSVADIEVRLLQQQLLQQKEMFTLMLANSKPPDLTPIFNAFRPPDPAAQFSVIMQAVSAVQGQKPDDSLSKVRDIIEISRTISGGGGTTSEVSSSTDGWLGIAQRVLDKLPALPAPKSEIKTPDHPKTTQKTEEEMEKEFLGNLSRWIDEARQAFAASKPAPEFAMQVWNGQKSQPHYHAVVTAIQSNATVEQLFMFAPVLMEKTEEKNWFEMVYSTLKTQYDESSNAHT